MRRGHPGRAGADDGNFFRTRNFGTFGKYVDGIARFRPMALGDKPLEGTNGDGCVKLAAAAGWLARMPADAATDGSERVRDPRVPVSLLVPPPRYQRDISPGLGMDGTGLHAGEVRLKPLEIYEFGPAVHEKRRGSLSGLFLDGQFDCC